jgi:glutamate synthase (NADPH/NADH)
MLLVDTKNKTVTKDEELKLQIAASRPLNKWMENLVTLKELRKHQGVVKTHAAPHIPDWVETEGRDRRLAMYGYTAETINMLLLPMVLQKQVLFPIE